MSSIRLSENQNVEVFEDVWDARLHMVIITQCLKHKISLTEYKRRLEKFKNKNPK